MKRKNLESQLKTLEHAYVSVVSTGILQCSSENILTPFKGCFAASWTEKCGNINSKMNSQVYQDILKDNVRLSLKFNRRWANSAPKHRRTSRAEWLCQKKIHLLEVTSPDLKLNEIF